MNLAQAYYQISMPDKYIKKTAITTIWKLFGNLKPFGLKNATQTSQRYIDTVFRGFNFIYLYIRKWDFSKLEDF